MPYCKVCLCTDSGFCYLPYKGKTVPSQCVKKNISTNIYIWIYVNTIYFFKNLYFLETMSITVNSNTTKSCNVFPFKYFPIEHFMREVPKKQISVIINTTSQMNLSYYGRFKSPINMWGRLSTHYELFIMHQFNKASQKHLRCTMQGQGQGQVQVLQNENELWLTLYVNI